MASSILIKELLALFLYVQLVDGEKCIPGEHHRNTSAPASKAYAECQAWNNDTCCTAKFTDDLNVNRVKNLYGFHWGHCKNLSLACEKYILAEECFYSCEPRLINWHVVNTTVNGVPVCSDYCDEWYKACENDQTCVADWLSGFNYTNNVYTCPKNSTCRTFKEIYGSGEKLCNTMWGRTFVYVDHKSCPCTRLDKPVPNNVNKNSTCSGSSPTGESSTGSSPTGSSPSQHSTFQLFVLLLGVPITFILY